MSSVLGEKDVNQSVGTTVPSGKPDVKSMEYHRQVLQSKLEADKYVPFTPDIPSSGH